MSSVMTFSAFGDALGAPYEFNEVLVDGSELTMLPYSMDRSTAGRWTDDSAMAIGIALGLLAQGDETARLDAIARHYRAWAFDDGAGIGRQTQSILRWCEADLTAEAMAALAQDHHRLNPDGSAGNGSLMRIHLFRWSATTAMWLRAGRAR